MAPRIPKSPPKTRAGRDLCAWLRIPKPLGFPRRITHRRDGVDGVEDGEEQDVVDAPGIVCVPGAGYLLAGGVVDEGWVPSDVDLVVSCVINSVAGAENVLKLHQGLSLLGHHHHVAGTAKAGVRPTPWRCHGHHAGAIAATMRVPSPDRAKLLQGLHEIGLHDAVDQPADVDHWGGGRLVGVVVVLLAGGKDAGSVRRLFPPKITHVWGATKKKTPTLGIAARPHPQGSCLGR